MSAKLLITLQYWKGDREQALNLAEFLADVEERHSDVADFLVIHHLNAKPPGELIGKLSRKFNSFVYKSPKTEEGWPQSCNAITEAAVEWVYCMKEANRIPNYKAIFLCEPDGAPIFRDWTVRMSKAWDVANQVKPVVIAGPLVQGPEWHINGNCMLSGDLKFLKWFARAPRQRTAGGWDYVMFPTFKQMGAANVPLMRSYYNTQHFSWEEYKKMQEEQLIWVHGDKRQCLINYGRQTFFGTL